MKTFLMAALTALGAAVWAAEKKPPEPSTPPIIYDQPGERFILRIDGRRYQISKTLRPSVAELISEANHPRTKLAYDELVAATTDLEKAQGRSDSAARDAARDASRSRRLADNLESLQRQLALTRSLQPVDLSAVSLIMNQISVESESLRRAQLQEEKSRTRAEQAERAAEPARERVRSATASYAKALEDYERPLARVRSIAMTNGSPL